MKPLCVIAAALVHSAALAGLPVLNAEVGEPVIPELMGGCSLKCSFDWSVAYYRDAAAKELPIAALNDEQPDVVWSDPKAKTGTRILFRFPKKLPAEMEGKVPLYGIDLINGDWRSEAAWAASARVKRARFFYNGKPVFEAKFPDTRKWVSLNFDDIMITSGGVLAMEVLETYGKPTAILTISEVSLQGGH